MNPPNFILSIYIINAISKIYAKGTININLLKLSDAKFKSKVLFSSCEEQPTASIKIVIINIIFFILILLITMSSYKL